MEKKKSTASIEDLQLFHDLSDNSKALLARGLSYAICPKTTMVLRKGQQVSGAYIVIGGQLRVFTLSPDGHEATLYLINPGETCVLALNCIFNDLLYPAWVEAKPETTVSIIPGKLYRELFEAESAIRNLTVQAFATIVFRLMTELEEIHSYRLEQRLASFLLLHASADAKLQMTQHEIASHLGTTREVIARILCQLVTKKHIKTSRNQIVITDPPKLAEKVRGMHTRAAKSERSSKAPGLASSRLRERG